MIEKGDRPSHVLESIFNLALFHFNKAIILLTFIDWSDLQRTKVKITMVYTAYGYSYSIEWRNIHIVMSFVRCSKIRSVNLATFYGAENAKTNYGCDNKMFALYLQLLCYVLVYGCKQGEKWSAKEWTALKELNEKAYFSQKENSTQYSYIFFYSLFIENLHRYF